MMEPRQIGVAVVGSGRIGTLRAHMASRHPWLDHLVTGRPCAHTTAREGRLTLEVTLAIEHSARTGEAVKLPFHGR